jgi:hypothetical protein
VRAPKPLSPAARLKAAKTACQDARDGRLDAPKLHALADAGEPLAVAAVAQVALFRGALREAATHAAAYLRAPSPKATGNLFTDMCRIVRATGDEAFIAESAASASTVGSYAGVVTASLRTDRHERFLVERATSTAAPDARARFEAACAQADGRTALARGTDARFRHEVALAWTFTCDDELLQRHEARPELFGWNDLLEVSFARLRAGDAEGAVRALDADPRRWDAVDAAQVVPVELATHPGLAGLMTPARGAYWLDAPRGR